MARAVRICPGLIVVRSSHSLYGQYSRRVMGILAEHSDLIEQISIDEAFLELSRRPEESREIGRSIQQQILAKIGLPNSVGIAANKLVAKIATDVGKKSAPGNQPPNAVTLVPDGEEAAFLAPLPVDMLWGVGPKTRERLEKIGVSTIGDLAAVPPLTLTEKLGKHGYDLARRAQGIDHRPLVTEREIKSVSNEKTFRDDIGRKSELIKRMSSLSRKVSSRLQKKGLKGKTIQIKLRWSDFTTITRQKTLPELTDEEATIQKTAQELLEQVWLEGSWVRLIGIGVNNLESGEKQLSLWDPRVVEDQRLEEALQLLRKKYGDDVITRGAAK
jgi:DNA polymerase-4